MCLTISNSLLIIDSLKLEIKEKIDYKLNKEYLESLLIIGNNNDKNNIFLGHIHSPNPYFAYLLIGESY